MNLLTTTRVVAWAVGISLAGTQAFAAPSDGRGDRNNNTASAEQGSKDQNDRDGQHKQQKRAKETPNRTHAVDPAGQANPRNVERRGATERQGRNIKHADDNGVRKDRDVRKDDQRPNLGNSDRRRHVDVTPNHRNFNAARRFSVEKYHRPYGYSYRRWNYGQHLPRHDYARNFRLMNFMAYGLFPPPTGYIWVRYGPDALLIDEYTGEIIQVQYNMFIPEVRCRTSRAREGNLLGLFSFAQCRRTRAVEQRRRSRHVFPI